MDSIFHEKQEGSLCGQHCLNALLQGEYFTAVDLATLATEMDEQERRRMAEAGVDSEEYRQFIEQGSQNMDDSGYFSIQVLSAALRVWSLDLTPFRSSRPQAVQARADVGGQRAYICNYRDHWLTIRKLGTQWFNLNSLLTGPELLTDTYLSEFLAQLQREGYTIFVVCGVLPGCAADDLLERITVTQPQRPMLISEAKTLASLATDEDAQIQHAIQSSLHQSRTADVGDEDSQLQAALQASLLSPASVGTDAPIPVDVDDIRARRENFLRRFDRS